MSPNVPNRVNEAPNYDVKFSARRQEDARRHRESEIVLRSRNECIVIKWTASGRPRSRINRRLVTETILFSSLLLVVLCCSTISAAERIQWQPNELQLLSAHNLSSSSHSKLHERLPRESSSFGSRIVSQMFASLGPRREHSALAMQESKPSLTFHLFDPAASQRATSVDQLLGAEALKGPPVYRSAPKQIVEVPKSPKMKTKTSMLKKTTVEAKIEKADSSPKRAPSSGPNDLHSAAAGHQHHHNHRGHKKRKKHAYPSHYTYFGKYHE